MIHSESTASKTAELLLQINAIKLNLQEPYRWASGWLSPIYTDNRLSLSYPEIRTYIKEQFAELVKQRFPECEGIAGVATAGIAHGALLADALHLPYCYVRSAPKSHGLSNMIEGRVVDKQKVVVVEDLVSTGGSSLNAVKALQAAGCEVLGLVAIFTYAFKLADDNFKSAGCEWFTLTDYHHVLNRALERNYIEANEVNSLQAWRVHPDTWSKGL
jgi:orotate phosphoribosyltransferase